MSDDLGDASKGIGEPSERSASTSEQAEYCDKFYKVASGDQCDVIETLYGISDNQFKEWNSEINAGMYPPCPNVEGGNKLPRVNGKFSLPK